MKEEFQKRWRYHKELNKYVRSSALIWEVAWWSIWEEIQCITLSFYVITYCWNVMNNCHSSIFELDWLRYFANMLLLLKFGVTWPKWWNHQCSQFISDNLWTNFKSIWELFNIKMGLLTKEKTRIWSLICSPNFMISVIFITKSNNYTIAKFWISYTRRALACEWLA